METLTTLLVVCRISAIIFVLGLLAASARAMTLLIRNIPEKCVALATYFAALVLAVHMRNVYFEQIVLRSQFVLDTVVTLGAISAMIASVAVFFVASDHTICSSPCRLRSVFRHTYAAKADKEDATGFCARFSSVLLN